LGGRNASGLVSLTVSESDPYFLGYRKAEQERLERQSQELAHESEWLFDYQ
jgi:hypothetical protein